MKINFIQISNILSFRYCEDIGQAKKIEFNKNLNILIGQNGSGKSTALEVINFIFKKVVFVSYSLNENVYAKKMLHRMKRRLLFQKMRNVQQSILD